MSDDYGLRQGPNGLLAPSAFWTAAPEWIAEINALHLSGVIGDVEHFEQMRAAWAYYAAVAEWGDSAFWAGKVK